MAKTRGDEAGLFWQTEVYQRRGGQYERPLPPIPETNWEPPTYYPDLSGQGMIAIDVETHDPDLSTRGPGAQRDGYLVGVSVGTEAGFRKYYPIAHEIGPNLDREVVLAWLNRELSRPGQPKVGANILYDLEYLTVAGVKVEGPFYDVQVAEPLLDENRLTYALEVLARDYLGEGKIEVAMRAWLTKAFGEKAIKSNIWRAPSAVVGPYAEGDVDLPLRIFAEQKKALEQQELWDLFIIESKLIPLLLAMRLRGVKVDLDAAERLRDRLRERQREAIARLEEMTDTRIDIWAAESVASAFDALSIPYLKTARGQPSFRKDWLANHHHPMAKLIVEARHLDKYAGTFVEGYILNGHVNGRMLTQFHQLRTDGNGTVSGRLSSSTPNLQNIPIRDPEFGPLIRAIFVPMQGRWWKLDWSQIEYRLIAHYAHITHQPGAKDVIKRYAEDSGVDYHQVIADMTGLPRRDAKNLNFGLAYGQGIDLLCFNLGVDRSEGERIINDYHERAPFIRPLAKLATMRANTQGEIRTLMGRKRRFQVWEDRNDGKIYQEDGPGRRRAFTHKALNALIQGSAADIMKKAMVDTWEAGCYDVLGAPHLTVHDELDGSLTETPAELEAFAEVKRIMETCVELTVPLRADGGFGDNWALAG